MRRRSDPGARLSAWVAAVFGGGLLACTGISDSVAAGDVCPHDDLVREELKTPSLEPGFELFVMRVKAPVRRGAVVLTHGAGSPSSAIWDLRRGGYSMMRALACAGFDAYALDVRGFGGSSRPQGLELPPDGQAPLVRGADVMPDVGAVVALAMKESAVRRVDLLGWSWGAEVAGMFASRNPATIRRLVLFAPVYDRRWKSRHVTQGGWRWMPRDEVTRFHDPAREELEVLEELAEGLFRFTEGTSLKLPNGPYRDIYGEDAPVWEPRRIVAATLVVRGAGDTASLDRHARRLVRDLRRASAKRYEVLPGLGHFAFRERGYAALHRAVIGFLTAPETPSAAGRRSASRAGPAKAH